MTQLTENVFAVEVPEGMEAFKVECMPEIDLYELDCYELGEYDEPVKEKSISLPTRFLATTLHDEGGAGQRYDLPER